MDIRRRIDKQARVRDALQSYLSRANLTPDQVHWLRGWWNRWCRYCLEIREELDYMSPQCQAWHESVRVILIDGALSFDFAGFQFPGAVELKPDSGRALRFGSPVTAGVLSSAFPATTFHGPVDCQGSGGVGDADFAGVKFLGHATFADLTFIRSACFAAAVFKDWADFYGATFRASADFERATFQGQTNFELARFPGCARTLSGECCTNFSEATFKADVSFKSAEFGRSAFFRDAVFEKPAIFTHKWFSFLRLSSTQRTCGPTPQQKPRAVRFGGDAYFEGARFLDGAYFSGAIFSNKGDFCSVKFTGSAHFGMTISRTMDFSGATFKQSAAFVKAIFNGSVRFFDTTFHGDANFAQAIFERNAGFGATTFRAAAILDEASFLGKASFRHLTFKQILSLRDVKFVQTPDFIQAHFKEPPDLDLITIGRETPEVPAEELTARWRALKRMAMQTGHHYYTALFAAEETKARRPIDRRQRLGAWVVGWLYQWLSNFGLSIWRPLAWWTASLFLFAVVYNGAGPKLFFNPTNGRICQLFDGTAWITGKFAAALTYSLEKALVIGGLAKVEGLDGLGTCLFDDPIPLAVIFTGIFQTAFSGLLILLFILAIRTHMRAR